MDWENERYVRVYTRNTVAWRMLPWQSKALWPLLLREVDRAGLLALDGHGARGLAALVELPPEVVEVGLQGLIEDGCVRLLGDGTRLFVPNFIAAQEAKQSDTHRQRESRERRRAIAQAEADGLLAVTNRDEASRNVTDCHENGQNVTSGHDLSQPVTPCLAVPSRTVPISPLPPADAGESTASRKPKRRKSEPPPEWETLSDEIEELKGIRYPPSAFEGLRERLREYSLGDLLAYVRWAAKDDFLGGKVQLKPSVLLRRARCAEGVAAARAKPVRRNEPDLDPVYRRLL